MNHQLSISWAHYVIHIPDCPACKKRGIIRNECDYDEYETHKSYSYHCGHYRNIKKKWGATQGHDSLRGYVDGLLYPPPED